MSKMKAIYISPPVKPYSINNMSFYNAFVRACVFLSETLMLLTAGDCLNTKYIGLGKGNYIYYS